MGSRWLCPRSIRGTTRRISLAVGRRMGDGGSGRERPVDDEQFGRSRQDPAAVLQRGLPVERTSFVRAREQERRATAGIASGGVESVRIVGIRDALDATAEEELQAVNIPVPAENGL